MKQIDRRDPCRFDDFIKRLPMKIRPTARRAVELWVSKELDFSAEEPDRLQFTTPDMRGYVRFVITEEGKCQD